MPSSLQKPAFGPDATLADALAFYRQTLGRAKELGPAAYLAAMAELGRRDLFFLLTRMLGREDAANAFVFARCREVQAAPDGYLDLWAREHFKSTIITCALTIQDLIRDPELTFGIFSHSRDISRGFLKQIKRELESNQILRRCYPEALYSTRRANRRSGAMRPESS